LLEPEADLVITKSDNPDAVIAGTSLTYTVVVQNNGPSDAVGVTVSDTLPAGLSNPVTSGCAEDNAGTPTCSLGTIAASGSAQFTITADVDANVPHGTTITNNATVTATTPLINTDDDSTSEDTLVNAEADLVITKTDSDDPVIAGTSMTYTITVQNNGPSDAQDVVVSDTLPGGLSNATSSGCAEDVNGTATCTLGTIAAGASAQFTIVVDVDADVLDGTVLTNNASVASSTTLINTDDDSTSETTDVIARADLSTTKTDDPDSVVAGLVLTYTITVNNAGPSDAQDVLVTDTLPAGVSNPVTSGCAEDANGVPTCSFGTIAAGASAQYTVTVDVDSGTLGLITNTATVSSSTVDPITGNETAAEGTTVIDVADLSITKLDDGDPVISGAGAKIVYTIEVTNAGPSDARNVNVFDQLPPNVLFQETVGCDNDPDGWPNCDLDYMVAGTSTSYTLEVEVFRSDDLITNTVTASTSATDPEGRNDSASQETQLIPIAIPVNNPFALMLMVLLLGGLGWVAIRRS